MALIDVVKWDGTPDIFAYKFPENNLTSFTQLIVNQSQEAAVFHKGKLVQIMEPGKHTLTNENFPFFEKLYGIPFGGKNPFTAEVWFVNKVSTLDIKWGTPTPILIKDPEYKVAIPVRAHGQFGIRINDSERFLLKLIGTLSMFGKTEITEYFRGLILANSTSVIAGQMKDGQISVLDIASQLLPLSESLRDSIKGEFENYGISLLNFYVNSISVCENDPSVEQLKALLSKKAEMEILGYTYQQERSFDVLENASKNEGASGTIMGAGMGVGMGFGVGSAVGGMMNDVGRNVTQPVSQSQTNVPASSSMAKIKCDKCGREIPFGAKFCPQCGDTYHPCPKCHADNLLEATVCSVCGESLGISCPGCKKRIDIESKFCPECGQRLIKQCTKCNHELKPDMRFCPECGEKNDE